jgi:DNA-binding LytR/AlgR family response regulator
VIQVAICDDDISVLETLTNYFRAREAQPDHDAINVSLYHSGEEFLKDIEFGASFHIVLMDIQMGDINGVDVGRSLRNLPNGDDAIMIYISSHDGYFEGLVDVGSFRFIRKPINLQNLDSVFTRALNQASKYKLLLNGSGIFKYKTETETHSVKTSSIVYIKHFMRVSELYIWDSSGTELRCACKFYAKLGNIVEQLPDEQFVRCERSYIVNLSFVSRMDKTAFILADKNESRIPISKSNKQQMKQAYFNHLERIT